MVKDPNYRETEVEYPLPDIGSTRHLFYFEPLRIPIRFFTIERLTVRLLYRLFNVTFTKKRRIGHRRERMRVPLLSQW